VSARIAVIGAGSWGTALAVLLGRTGCAIRLWARRRALGESLRAARENPQYLPDVAFPDAVTVALDLAEALADAEFVLVAVPAKGMRETVRRLRDQVAPGQAVVSVAKGLESDSGLRMSQVIIEELGDSVARPSAATAAPTRRGLAAGRLAVLSGPNLAVEVAAGMATATVIASPDADLARRVQAVFLQPTFRAYTNPDVIGVELGGALKNVIAIGAGINDGLGFGDNTKAAVVTRGLAEITRLGVAMGAQAATFMGLAGVGDLVATCASRRSRNHRVGFELAQGKALPDILAGMKGQEAEGVPTTRAARMLAHRHGVEMPITEAIHAVLFEGLSPRDAVAALMTRRGKDELEEAWLRPERADPPREETIT
jgi:glycerol-3-phosphate dehydrogenase (NAD(P)+)